MTPSHFSLGVSSLCVADTIKDIREVEPIPAFLVLWYTLYSDVIRHLGVGTSKAIAEAFLINKGGHE